MSNEQNDSASKGVSEAAPEVSNWRAPERIWLQESNQSEDWAFALKKQPSCDKDIPYARVHQPPEQNSEDKNSVSGASDRSTSRIPKDTSLTLTEIRERRAKITTTPWEAVPVISGSEWRVINGPPQVIQDEMSSRRAFTHIPDADFIANAPTDIATLLSIIDSLQPSDWQPIETAPKDGTSVLLVWNWDSGIHTGTDVVQARWMCRKHSHLSRHHDCPNESDCDMGWNAYGGNMSHWMPLPSLPITQAGASASALSQNAPDHSQASPSESESVVTVDEAARRAAKEIAPMLDPWMIDMKHAEDKIAEIITTELSIHQPDVKAVELCLMADCDEPQAHFCVTHVLDVHCPSAKRLQYLEDQFRVTDSKRVTESCNSHGQNVAVFYCGAECPLCAALDALQFNLRT